MISPLSKSLPARTLILALGSAAAVLTTGCALSSSVPISTQGSALQGHVHGGQQPVSGATIQLYAAGTTGYGSPARAMIASSVKSGTDGTFTITGDYTCQAGDQVYVTATGGNPGVTGTHNNSALVLMTGLGACSALSSTTSIEINELTTVASVYALSPFMKGVANVGTSATNVIGLTNAFAAINKIVDTSAGTLPGPALPTGATLPTLEINTLADIVAACVNTVDTTSVSSTCTTVFSATTPTAPGAVAPTTTLQAALNIARHPTLGLTLGSLITPTAPFQSNLGSSAPSNWTIAINYIGGGIAAPKSIAVDASGDVWTANTTSVSKLSNSGAALSPASGFTAGALNTPHAIAIDAAQNAWVANGNSTVTKLASSGSTGTAYSGGGLTSPSSVAIDAAGNAWLLNSNNSLSEFSNSGVALSPTAGFTNADLTAGTALSISPH